MQHNVKLKPSAQGIEPVADDGVRNVAAKPRLAEDQLHPARFSEQADCCMESGGANLLSDNQFSAKEELDHSEDVKMRRLQQSRSLPHVPDHVSEGDGGTHKTLKPVGMPIHEMRPALVKHFGGAGSALEYPGESKLAARIDLAVSSLSRASGVVLFAGALLWLGSLLY